MALKHWHRSSSIFEAFTFALRGIGDVFVREQNVRIQLLVGTLVVCAMFFLRIPLSYILIGILAIFLIITLEMVNTSLELLCDLVHPEYSAVIKSAKDIAAGAVLLAGIGAGIIGILIFIPAIFNLLTAV